MAVTSTEIKSNLERISTQARNIELDSSEIRKRVDRLADNILNKKSQDNTLDKLHGINRRLEFIDMNTKNIVELVPNLLKRIEELSSRK